MAAKGTDPLAITLIIEMDDEMSNIWIGTAVVVVLAFLSVRTYHITLKRRFDEVRVEVVAKLLGLITIKKQLFTSVVGTYMKSVTDKEGFKRYRVMLKADLRKELLKGKNLSERRAFELTEKINDFIENSGKSNKIISIKEGVGQLKVVIIIALVVLSGNGIVDKRTTSSSKGETLSDESSSGRDVNSVKSKELSNMPVIPDGAMDPEFCRITEVTSDVDGGKYDLWGEMNLPIRNAGNRINAFMRNNSTWETVGVIKQYDAAELTYSNGELYLSYLFLKKSSGANSCIISWQPVGDNEND